MEKSQQRSIRLKTTFISEIEAMAKEQNRTFNNMIETLLIKAVQNSKIL